MRPSGYLLALEQDRWRVVRILGGRAEAAEIAVAEGMDLAAQADRLAEALGELGYAGGPVCLGLPSSMVLAAPIDCSRLGRRRGREAMLYLLEDALPVEAERLTADFTEPQAGRTLGMAVRNEPVAAILRELERAGVAVGAISATALLAAWDACRPREPACHYAVVAGSNGTDVLRMAEGAPRAWYRCGLGAEEAVRAIHADMLTSPLDTAAPVVRLVGAEADGLAAALEGAVPAQVVSDGAEPAVVRAARAAEALLAGRPAGWADFRRGALADQGAWRRHGARLRVAVALALVLPAVLAGSMLWRAWRYDSLRAGYDALQAAEYRRLYPQGAMPIDVESRLRSEAARLAGLSGADRGLPQQTGALELLRRAIGGLPASVKLKVSEVRVSPTAVLIEGRVLAHADAAAISQALGRSGLVADPPRTEQLPGGEVAFTITARPAPTESGPAGGGP